MRKIKPLIKLQILKLKRSYYEKRYKISRKKTLELEGKFRKTSTSVYYAIQNTNPKRTWEMRAERERLKHEQ